MRMTKIVCTMGPACDNVETIGKMIEAGMNVARFNMSHGTYDEQQARFDRAKEAISKSGKTVSMLLDTKGPEIRIGTFPQGSVEVVEGQDFRLYSKQSIGDENGVSLSYPKLVSVFAKDKSCVGRQILFDDGKIVAKVVSADSDAIVCRIQNGGRLSNRKSINIPDYNINMPYISAADRADIEFGLKQGVNVVAARNISAL